MDAEEPCDEMLNAVLAKLVEPNLRRSGLEIIFDYPAIQFSLAALRVGSAGVAERFELY